MGIQTKFKVHILPARKAPKKVKRVGAFPLLLALPSRFTLPSLPLSNLTQVYGKFAKTPSSQKNITSPMNSPSHNSISSETSHSLSPTTYQGPNFCPNCGCSIRSVALALIFAETTQQISAGNRGAFEKNLSKKNSKVMRSVNGDTSSSHLLSYSSTGNTRITRTPITPELRASVSKLRAQHVSLPQIAQQLGLKPSTVNYLVYGPQPVGGAAKRSS